MGECSTNRTARFSSETNQCRRLYTSEHVRLKTKLNCILHVWCACSKRKVQSSVCIPIRGYTNVRNVARSRGKNFELWSIGFETLWKSYPFEGTFAQWARRVRWNFEVRDGLLRCSERNDFRYEVRCTIKYATRYSPASVKMNCTAFDIFLFNWIRGIPPVGNPNYPLCFYRRFYYVGTRSPWSTIALARNYVDRCDCFIMAILYVADTRFRYFILWAIGSSYKRLLNFH